MRLSTRVLGIALLHVTALVPAVALAGPTAKKRAEAHLTTAHLAQAPPARSHEGVSVGSPTEGYLIGGAHVTPSATIRLSPAYEAGDAHWGLDALVGLIDHAAHAVRRQFPDAVLTVGHLSRPGGGEIDRHASHESGRDADLQFYMKNEHGKPVLADHFVAFHGDGTAPSFPGARFDDAKNWALVAALLSDARAHVTHIFVATPIRARLLSYAERIGAPAALRTRAAELMAQPKGALPHDDHFHVRIACPAGMDKCIEQPVRHHLSASVFSAHADASHAARHGAAPAPPRAPRVPAAPVAPAAPKPDKVGKSAEKKEHDEAAKSEGSAPILGPAIPGLDSVVIPAPLDAPAPSAAPSSPMPSKPDIIDDPDGVLDGHAR